MAEAREAQRTHAPPGLDALETRALVPVQEQAGAPARREPWACPFCAHRVEPGSARCPGCGAQAVPPDAVAIDALRGNARAVYALQALTPLCGVTAVLGLVMAYANRGQARDTWLDSHYEWQIDSFWGVFWFTLASMVAGRVTHLLGAGQLAEWVMVGGVLAASAWFIHRVVKGWMRLSDGDPVTDW